MNDEYAAGLIDGEGWIGIQRTTEVPALPDAKPFAIYRWGWWWEPEESLFGPVEFEGQFPTSGMMVAGRVYDLT